MTPEKLAEGKRLVEAAKATGLDETSTTRENGDAKRWLLRNARDLLAAVERAQRAEHDARQWEDVAQLNFDGAMRNKRELATAERERDEARKVLREFEWEAIAETIPDYDRPSIVECRVCHGRRDNGGHEAGCRVDRALGGGK